MVAGILAIVGSVLFFIGLISFCFGDEMVVEEGKEWIAFAPMGLIITGFLLLASAAALGTFTTIG